ncbi:hypothetical protein HU200_003839 [Digitaria exilis]|uniref:Late embryogenesis abundant protein LEA-2 subgroup domain-containing protein n=1 Tax=Digitaria exilis TaxID=1010633 RepID=A0A835FVY8_9POAL|nr:hypothetical protein HU200_003839 [Digitaria exilis]
MAEERALQPAVPPPASPEPASSSAVSTAFGSPLEPAAAATPPSRHDTYVVQVQKDQIYRVPPPENAYLAERYRNARGGGKKTTQQDGPGACSPCVARTLGAVVAAAALLGAAVLISLVVLRPGVPSFSVDRLTVRDEPRTPPRTDFDFFLTAVNPSKMTALWYRSGTARLLHQGTTLAKGDVGQPADGGEDATDFSVVLRGVPRDGRAHAAVDKALIAGNKGHHVELELAVEVTVQVHVGALGFGQRRLAVDCRITAAGLRKDVHISSQNCTSRFRN